MSDSSTSPVPPTTSAADPVPLMDPQRVYPSWGPDAERAVVDVLRSHCYVKGPQVAAFEEAFAQHTGVAHAVAVDSCTDALFLVLRAVLSRRPPEQREVILPPFTFVATASAVVNAGGVPVFADIDPDTWNLAPSAVAANLSERTAAVVPVHIFGSPADVPAIRRVLCDAGSDAFVLEDAAQAIAATLEGRRAGALADAGTFSFYPSKNLAAVGDGGVVTTDDDILAARVRALRDHGQTRKMYDHEDVGTNSRMDEIQAAVLRLKLEQLDAWTHQRRAVAARYDAAFADLPLAGQRVLPDAESVYHLYSVRTPERDALRAGLQEARIGCGVYYPVPLHRQTCFGGDDAAESCPEADALSAEVLALPCFPGMVDAEVERVTAVVRSLLAE
ncbi:MAG: DegT/DnrJ/EryC1/StrS family aminotransferase [Planctomycetota bacterium]|nr:DegT/DnrJ/EryC1/StrS family aminotransferase [Planctomycetota bacterium]